MGKHLFEINFSNWDSKFYFEITLCFVISFCLLKYIFDKHRRDHFMNLAAQLPGPYALPFLGNSLNFLFPGPDGLVGLQKKYYEKYGAVYRVWLGNQLWVGLSEPEDLKVVFNSSKASAKSRIFEPHCTFFGNGLAFVLSGSQWRVSRKRLQPFFTKEVVSSFVHKINKSIRKLENVIGEQHQNSEFDVSPMFAVLSLDFMSYTQFNYEIDWNGQMAVRLTQEIDKTMNILRYQIFLPFLRTKLFNYFLYKISLNGIKERLEADLKMIIKDCLTWHQKMMEVQQPTSEIFSSSFLSSSYYLSKQIGDDKFIVEDVIGVIVPALLTMMKHMSYFVFMIAVHSDVQQKIFNELNSVFGTSKRPAGLDDISRLTYLDQVIKECHRVFIFSTILWRELERDTQIGKYVFPAGTGIMINEANLHLNPQYYPHPHVFNPDNFKPEAVRNRPKYCFLPFGAGSRSCIGVNFAELTIKLTLVALLRVYTFHTSVKMEDLVFERGFTTRNYGGYRVQFKPRDLSSSEK